MTFSRLFSVAFVAAVASAAVVVACGGDTKNGPDAKVFLDSAGSGGSGSGSGSGSGNLTGLGQHCTPGTGSNQPQQGDCPGGYVCLNLTGGHDAWCSKVCAQGSGDMCNVGYTGPGEGACGLTLGSAGPTYCLMICSLTINGSNACPNCNDTCRSPLTCTESLTCGGSGNNRGSACI
jgi:hypothetical protein